MPNQVFISYSHRDKKWLERLQIFLKSVEHQQAIWVDTEIEIGDDWREKIRRALESARVAILLVSQDFIASDFVAQHELPPLLAAARTAGAVIVQVIISPCVLPDALSQFQAANPLDKTLVDMKRGERDRIWVKVVERVKKALAASENPLPIDHQAARRNILTEVKRRIDSFVDRKKELASFCQMLEKREKRVMCVWGESGIGKTALFYRMVYECELRQHRRTILTWTDIRRYDYLDIMRKIQDDFGGETFKPFAEEVSLLSNSPLSNPGAAEVGNGHEAELQRGESNTGLFSIPGSPNVQISDLASIEKSRMIRLTNLFLVNLAGALEKSPLIVLLDGVEKMSPDTSEWFRQQLLRAAADGRLRNICFVLCGRDRPPLEGVARQIVEVAELQPLGSEDIAEYLATRLEAENLGNAVTKTVCLALANRILTDTHGKPDDVANWVEGIINDVRTQ